MLANTAQRTTATLGVAALFGIAALASSIRMTGSDVRVLLVEENGIVQILSAFGYLVCLALIIARAGTETLARRWYMAVLLPMMTMRELDFHTRFFSMGIFKTRFYVSPDVPAWEKLIALATTILLLTAVVALAKNHFHAWIRDLRRLRPVAVWFLLAAGCAVAAKGIDGVTRKLSGFGYSVSANFTHNAVLLEELLELGIPAMLIVAACTMHAAAPASADAQSR